MILSRKILKSIESDDVVIPEERVFELPEKVLQFGTGVLLRGLPDYFIDKANHQGIFNGRIVVVKSTDKGDSTAFDVQDGLYTQCVRGLENGNKVEENIINASISRVLSAKNDWNKILQCAHNPHMQIIISNTTEVGIQLVNDSVTHQPPISFPGKLLAFLVERFRAFSGSAESGMVIVPTELIPDNGKKLFSIVLELAKQNNLPEVFIEWLKKSNHFCNSLVDRIVPGKPPEEDIQTLENTLGYKDELMIMSEVYRLWAIEGNSQVKNILSFAQVDEGVVIESDIDLYRELKLRLLNGTHTLSCGLAFLMGIDTVKQAMDNELVSTFIAEIMQNELAASIPYEVDPTVAKEFGLKVLDRFRNPSIKHRWINITVQYSSKMKMRNIPMLLKHYEKSDAAPQRFALGFAAYIYFMRAVKKEQNKYYGISNGEYYVIEDDKAAVLFDKWNGRENSENISEEVLKDTSLWGTDLTALPGFAQAVSEKLDTIRNGSIKQAIENVMEKRELV